MSDPWIGFTALYVDANVSGGSHNGTSWANAYLDLPTTLVRNRVYYVADGTYASYTFNTANNGTQMIYIVKATVADHGSSTGWSDTMGDGEALFSSSDNTITVAPSVGYLWWDGNSRGTGFSPGSFGFRFYSTASRAADQRLLQFDQSGDSDFTGNNHNMTWRYIELDFNNGTSVGAGATKSLIWNTALACNNWTVAYCYFHHSSGFAIYVNCTGDNWVFDHLWIDECGGSTGSHYEGIWFRSKTNSQISNMQFRNMIDGDMTGWLMMGNCDTVNVFGNQFWCTNLSGAYGPGGNGILSTWSHDTDQCNAIKIVNNTFANLPSKGIFDPQLLWTHDTVTDTNMICRNNILRTANMTISIPGTVEYNAFGGGATATGTNQQTGLATSIFVDWTNYDFHLASHTTAGTAVISPFTPDPDGVTRTAPDRGAFELNTGSGGRGTATGAWLKA